MDSTPPKIREDKEITNLTQHHHSERNLATQVTEDNAKNEARKKTLEEPTQTVELNRVRETNDGTKGHAPRAKTSKNVKAIKQPSNYQTHLVPGINTEKHPYEAGGENKD